MIRLLYLVAACLPLILTAQGISGETPPHVLIIYADDMGYGDLACQNPEAKLTTPHLDQLASEGMRFTDAHSSSGICSPSRFALLTGQYHWRRMHGIVHAMGGSVFRSGDVTIAKLLQEHGYHTGCIGKWHLGWDWTALQKSPGKLSKEAQFLADSYDWTRSIPAGPLSVGFDTYFGDGTINFPPYCWIENDRVVAEPTREMSNEYLRKLGYQAKEGSCEFRKGPTVEGWNPYEVLPTLANRGVEWLHKQSADQPFFLYFALPSPHAPIIPNDEFDGATQAGAYGDFVYQTDHVVGQLLAALQEKGLADNTLVIFTSDNGPEKYAFARMEKHDHASAGSLRGLKRDVWEGGHRVPMIVRWPTKVASGLVSDQLIGQIDLFATIASAVGVEVPEEAAVDSLDMTDVLTGKSTDHPTRSTLVHNTYPNIWGIRHDNWLYIDGSTGQHSKAPESYLRARGYAQHETPGLLFNLQNDLSQHHNLYEERPEVVAQLKTRLTEARAAAPR